MRKLFLAISLFPLFLWAQSTTPEGMESVSEFNAEISKNNKRKEGLNLQVYRYKEKELYEGEWIYSYLLPELPVYPPMKFKNERQRQQFNKLVQNVKKTLPIAQRVRGMIAETYEVLQQLPDDKSRKEHIAAVEKSIKEQFTPEMKKLTYSQGKLLIKLVDRECHQSSYEIVRAFFGPTKAAFYQMFAWTFRSSLKKEYRPEDDDRLVERVVRQVETGQL